MRLFLFPNYLILKIDPVKCTVLSAHKYLYRDHILNLSSLEWKSLFGFRLEPIFPKYYFGQGYTVSSIKQSTLLQELINILSTWFQEPTWLQEPISYASNIRPTWLQEPISYASNIWPTWLQEPINIIGIKHTTNVIWKPDTSITYDQLDLKNRYYMHQTHD